MQTETFLKAYMGLAAAFALPTMIAREFVRTVQRFESGQALYPVIEKFAPSEGWLCFQSAVRYVNRHETLFANDARVGLLLNAEFVNEAGVSLHVRHVGGAWATARFAPHADEAVDESGKAESYWVDSVEFNAADPKRGLIRYDRLWQQREIVGIVPVAARFVGFSANAAATKQSQERSA